MARSATLKGLLIVPALILIAPFAVIGAIAPFVNLFDWGTTPGTLWIIIPLSVLLILLPVVAVALSICWFSDRLFRWRTVMRCNNCKKVFRGLSVVSQELGLRIDIYGRSIGSAKDVRIISGNAKMIYFAGSSLLEIEGKGEFRIAPITVRISAEKMEVGTNIPAIPAGNAGGHFVLRENRQLQEVSEERCAPPGALEISYWLHTVEITEASASRRTLCLLHVSGHRPEGMGQEEAIEEFREYSAELASLLLPERARITGFITKRSLPRIEEVEEAFEQKNLEVKRSKRGLAFGLRHKEEVKFLLEYVWWTQVIPLAFDEKPLDEIKPFHPPWWGIFPRAATRAMLEHTLGHEGDIFLSPKHLDLIAWHSSKGPLEISGRVREAAAKKNLKISRVGPPWGELRL